MATHRALHLDTYHIIIVMGDWELECHAPYTERKQVAMAGCARTLRPQIFTDIHSKQESCSKPRVSNKGWNREACEKRPQGPRGCVDALGRIAAIGRAH